MGTDGKERRKRMEERWKQMGEQDGNRWESKMESFYNRVTEKGLAPIPTSACNLYPLAYLLFHDFEQVVEARLNVLRLRFLALFVGQNLIAQTEGGIHFQRFPRSDAVFVNADQQLRVVLLKRSQKSVKMSRQPS